ncbi:MAG TPA: saccharopine dehydrogenase [Amycolatopsis sp.]|jgi:saccharopine dehydrogenase (NAD+, L-lysine-forming)|nr:saccharopine dehydrogenase [Amycolatopsis sp.]
MARLWLRHEARETERRAAVTPADAARLVAAGNQVTVERSPQRVFPIEDYAAAGCGVAPAGSWIDAPDDTWVIGLKELPAEPAALRHRHVYFGHAYKGQPGAAALLHRFTTGGGRLLDLEYLTDEHGRRLAAFGYWAGYVGAALAILHLRGTLETPLRPLRRADLDAALAAPGEHPRVLVVGALGRGGRGARDACAAAGIRPTAWDLAETRHLDRSALLAHHILVNTVLSSGPATPLLTEADLDDPARALRVISDVTCDVGSACNVLPVYDRVTTWAKPVRPLREGARPVDLIAIDNLPSLLPRESSESFSAELADHLLDLTSPPWARAAGQFRAATEEKTHV